MKKRNMNLPKRLLASALALSMCAGMVCTTAFAADEDPVKDYVYVYLNVEKHVEEKADPPEAFDGGNDKAALDALDAAAAEQNTNAETANTAASDAKTAAENAKVDDNEKVPAFNETAPEFSGDKDAVDAAKGTVDAKAEAADKAQGELKTELNKVTTAASEVIDAKGTVEGALSAVENALSGAKDALGTLEGTEKPAYPTTGTAGSSGGPEVQDNSSDAPAGTIDQRIEDVNTGAAGANAVVGGLNADQAAADSAISAAKEALEAKAGEVEEAKASADAAIKDVKDAFESAKGAAEAAVSTANEQVEAYEAEQARLNSDLQSKINDLGTAPSATAPVRDSFATQEAYEAAHSEWAAAVEAYNTGVRAIQGEYDQAKQALDAKAAEANDALKAARERLSDAEAALERLNTAAEGAYTDLVSSDPEVQAALEAYKAAAEAYNAKCDAYNEAAGAYNEAAGKYNEAAGKFETDAGEYNTAVNTYNTAVGEYNTAAGNYGGAVGEYNAAVGEYNTAVGEYNTAVGTYNSDVDKYNTAVGAHNELANGFNERVGAYNSAVDTYNSAAGAYQDAAGAYNAAAEAYKTAAEAYNVKVDGYNGKAVTANSKNYEDEIWSKLKDVSTEEINVYKDTLKAAPTDVTALTDEQVDQYNAAVDAYNRAVAKYNEDLWTDTVEKVKAYSGGQNSYEENELTSKDNVWYTVGKINVSGVFINNPGEIRNKFENKGQNDFASEDSNRDVYYWINEHGTDGTTQTTTEKVQEIEGYQRGKNWNTLVNKLAADSNFEAYEDKVDNATWGKGSSEQLPEGFDPLDNANISRWVLKVSPGGAADYVNDGVETWHLDGYMYVRQVSQLATLEKRVDADKYGTKNAGEYETMEKDDRSAATVTPISDTQKKDELAPVTPDQYPQPVTIPVDQFEKITVSDSSEVPAVTRLEEAKTYSKYGAPDPEPGSVSVPTEELGDLSVRADDLEVAFPDRPDTIAITDPTRPVVVPPVEEETEEPTGGGGGGTTGGGDDTPVVVVPETEVPLVEIPEEEVPLAEEPVVEIPEEEVPLVEIPDEEVPLAAVPKTGDVSSMWYLVTLLSACGLAALVLRRKTNS